MYRQLVEDRMTGREVDHMRGRAGRRKQVWGAGARSWRTAVSWRTRGQIWRGGPGWSSAAPGPRTHPSLWPALMKNTFYFCILSYNIG